MALDITAVGAAGTHSISKTNVHVPDNYIYFKSGSPAPAAITEGSPWIF